ncbi:Dioxygenase [Lacticaseibacillus saniviri JCM 17471 = DSM 24301]|uniref:Probable nitronate monooxygenase n=2 Tax=Lacticaseibacillus saniviri TaxID=931533 RepID=A0A0R2MVN3_9LACO|nr:Dioxygenase [Lacticaseibacillus saniviri JCM 17471 = DSM 24301]
MKGRDKMNALTARLGIKYPIFQGGMAWVADGKLAAAVSNAGGLGIIGSGHAPASYVQEQIDIARELTDKPFGVNMMLLSPFVDDVLEVVLKSNVALVTTGAGDPAKYLKRLQAQNIMVLPVVPSVGLAKRMARQGVDGVIAEGMESGGHIGQMTTMTLVPQVVDAVDIPVIAAGGIGDGRGLAAALALGAVGVQMGTRFLTATESRIHENYKAAVIKAKDVDTLVTGQYVGHAARVLKNPMSRNFLKLEREIALSGSDDFKAVEELGNGSLRKAVLDGDRDEGSFMAGQISGLVKREESSAEIIQSVMAEANALLDHSALQQQLQVNES